jgi:predicted ABC-type ATPase
VESNAFENLAKELCETFVNESTLLRQQLPYGLTNEEMQCIRRVAANYNLSIVKQIRLNNETFFLTSKNYYNRQMI